MKAFLASAILVSFAASNVASAFTVSLSPTRLPNGGRIVQKIHSATGITVTNISAGHEEITRQALKILRDEVLPKEGIDIKNRGIDTFIGDVDLTDENVHGYYTKNMIIRGNYSTDMPDGLEWIEDIKKRWNNYGQVNWDLDPSIQVLHFLRNINTEDTSLITAKDSCYTSRSRIKANTQFGVILWKQGEVLRQKAIELWNAGRKDEANKLFSEEHDLKRRSLFLFGHATHTLQDSFSPAHTDRGGKAENYSIKQIGFYGDDVKAKLVSEGRFEGMKYHPSPSDPVEMLRGDGIWIRGQGQYRQAVREWGAENVQCDPEFQEKGDTLVIKSIDTDSERTQCMKHEARLARTATVRYLHLVAKYLSDWRLNKKMDPSADADFNDLHSQLDSKLFDGSQPVPGLPNVMQRGVMRCDALVAEKSPIRNVAGVHPAAKENGGRGLKPLTPAASSGRGGGAGKPVQQAK